MSSKNITMKSRIHNTIHVLCDRIHHHFLFKEEMSYHDIQYLEILNNELSTEIDNLAAGKRSCFKKASLQFCQSEVVKILTERALINEQ